MSVDVQIEIVNEPGEELVEAVNYELRTFNQVSNPRFWEARSRPENRPRPLNIFAFDEDRGVMGGLFASTQFSWLRIDLMAVREDFRGRGVGSDLLARAEDVGRERGCKYSFTDTMDYQAPGFWEKAGYRVAGEIDDWNSHGNRKYFFTRDLS